MKEYTYIINRINARLHAVRLLIKTNNKIMSKTYPQSPAHRKALTDMYECLIIEKELLKLKAKPNEK